MIHHTITKSRYSDGHTYHVESTLTRDGRVTRVMSFGRAGLPEKVMELFKRLIEENESKIARAQFVPLFDENQRVDVWA